MNIGQPIRLCMGDIQVGDVIRVFPKDIICKLWDEHFHESLERLSDGEQYIQALCDEVATVKRLITQFDNLVMIETEENIECSRWALFDWEVELVNDNDNLGSSNADFIALFGG